MSRPDFQDMPPTQLGDIPRGGRVYVPMTFPTGCRPIAVVRRKPIKVGRGVWRQVFTIKVLDIKTDRQYLAAFELHYETRTTGWWSWLCAWVRAGFRESRMVPKLEIGLEGVPRENYSDE